MLYKPILYHTEISAPTEVEFALHHVEKDRDGCFSQLRLWRQGHFQNWAHHGRDELDLMGP